MRTRFASFTAVLLLLALVMATCPEVACADSWTQIAYAGMTQIQRQDAATPLVVFNGNLYAGTGYQMAQVWEWDGVNPWAPIVTDGFGQGASNEAATEMLVFNPGSGDHLYVGVRNGSGCQVWEWDGTNPWAQVNTNGFGDADNDNVYSMGLFNSKLYVGTGNQADGCEVWEWDGTNPWAQVNTDGFGNAHNWEADSMATFNPGSGTRLYVGTMKWDPLGVDLGCDVWEWDGVNPWTQVNTDGFGDPTNAAASSLAVFDPGAGSRLYAGACNGNGCQVWEWDGTNPWAQVSTNGFGDANNTDARALRVFNPGGGNRLYAGTVNWTSGVEVWVTQNGTIWTQMNADGFGTPDNTMLFELAQFGSNLFAGTMNSSSGGGVFGYDGLSWYQANRYGFIDLSNSGVSAMAGFNSNVYVGTENGIEGCEVYEWQGADPWAQVNASGFGDDNNDEAFSMGTFGSMLYLGTRNNSTGCEVWRWDGSNPWAQANTDGFGDASNEEADSLAEFESKVYTGTYNSITGCEVWRFDGPNPSDWVQVNTDGFGDLKNTGVFSMAVFNSKLYAGVWNDDSAAAKVMRYDGPNPSDWTQVNVDGFGDNRNYCAYSMAVYNGMLYVGTYNSNTGCEVWRWDGTNPWAQVNTDGFGDASNERVYSMRVFNYQLYCATENSNTGCEVWRYDWSNWTQANTDGFGDDDNYAAKALAVDAAGGTLYAGTYNPSDGCSVYSTTGEPMAAPNVTGIVPNSGDAGTTVSVTDLAGTGFIPGATVELQKPSKTPVPGTNVNVVSPIRITCDFVIPPGTEVGAWNVYVENPDWQSDVLTDGFTVTGAPAPTVTSITPSGGTRGTTVNVTSLGGTGFSGTPVVKLKKAGQGDITASNVVVISPTQMTCRFDLPGAAAVGAWDVYVQNPDGQNATLAAAFTVADVTPPPSALSTWYLAEGTTAWGFTTHITIENPNTAAVNALVTYMPRGGANVSETVSLPAQSQTTITNDHLVQKMGGQMDFSTKVEATDNSKAIAVDRTMEWTGGGAGPGKGSAPEGHSSVGVNSPATTWYLPEGSTNWGFETWLLIQNPNAAEASCSVTYMIEGEGPKTFSHTVPANSRESYSMQTDAGNEDASIMVTSNIPVIPERAMYRYNRREGHDSIGTTTPATDFYLAEGAVGYDSGYTTYVLVQNPQNSPTDVNVTYLTGSGQVAGPTFQMPANSRKTVRVNDVLPPGTDVSTSVHGSQPIIAERAMYWNSAAGEACHDSIGMCAPAMTFYLPDGETSNGRETWTLVQNPNGVPVEVTVSYLAAAGGAPISFNEVIPANSRRTFNMADRGVAGRAGVLVASKSAPIMVERAMYWSNRSAGTDTIGGCSN